MTEQQVIPWLESPRDFPPVHEALKAPAGLLAASLEINADWLLASYERGIFPWYSRGEPVLWWCTAPRAVLYVKQFKLHRSLRKTLRKVSTDPAYKVLLNHDFRAVMRACAEPRPGQDGTWITHEIIDAYCELHRRGFAHSIGLYRGEHLIGGLYCVALGGMVYGESMFSRQADASKLAFAHFVTWLDSQNVRIIDCQQATEHLISLGATVLPLDHFLDEMTSAQKQPVIDWAPKELIWMNDQT